MSDKYNFQIAKLGGLINSISSEIANDKDLQEGEKFLLLQRIIQEIAPTFKAFKKTDTRYKSWGKENLSDGEVKEYEGVEISMKYNNPPAPTLNAEKLKEDLIRALTELKADFQEDLYLDYKEPAKKVIIQSILKKNKIKPHLAYD